MEKDDLSIYVIPHSGAIEVAAIVGNYREKMVYYGYTQEEAAAEFLAQYK